MLTGLHHVQLTAPAGSEDVLRAFYAGVLGMAEVMEPAPLGARGGCWFRSGAVEIHVGVEAAFRAARKAHPGVLVDDLDALAARLADAGAPVRWDGEFPGHRRFYSEDPHGNRLEFLSPVERGPDAGP
ncbi:MAG: glyoxalase [Actinomycetota bacterium]|nr:glyoxalase [Actinomycetota bacterium]